MRFLALALFLLLSAPALAVQPDEVLNDPVLELRARDISKNLRCLVCQGEDIDESNAGLASDIRKLVRERLTKGDSDTQVLDFVQARYGDYVLMKPPVKPATWLLWCAPFLVLALGLGAAYRVLRRQKKGGG